RASRRQTITSRWPTGSRTSSGPSRRRDRGQWLQCRSLAGARPRFPRFDDTVTGYAIISLGGKQYRVREGERLLVDRLPYEEGKTFHPPILFVGGDGDAEIAPKGVQVTARVAAHV